MKIYSVLLVFLLASSGFAEHEDVVDQILAAISGKFAKTAVPYYVSSMNQNIKSMIIKFTLVLRNGQMSMGKLVRNGDVTYVSDNNEATFKFKASLETSIGYSYSFESTTTPLSRGTATADWKSDVDMVITATTEGCELKITDTRNTKNFDIYFEPYSTPTFSMTVHYPAEDVVEKNVLPALENSLNKAVSGWKICDIFDC